METAERKTEEANKQAVIHCTHPLLLSPAAPSKGRRAFLLPLMTRGTEGQRWRKTARGGEKKNSKDLFIEGRRSSGCRVDASEFLIIATATSHLATAYTMAAVALATAWSLLAVGGCWGVAAGSRGDR